MDECCNLYKSWKKEQLEANNEIEIQRNELRDFCEKKKYQIVSEYVER